MQEKRPYLHYISLIWRLQLITSVTLSVNSILEFMVSVEHSENRILYIPKTSEKSSIQQIHVLLECQIGKPRIKNAIGDMSFVPLTFLYNVNLLQARLGHSRSALISNSSYCINNKFIFGIL